MTNVAYFTLLSKADVTTSNAVALVSYSIYIFGQRYFITTKRTTK